MKLLVVVLSALVIFFYGSLFSSIPSTVNNQSLEDHIRLSTLQMCMHDLWYDVKSGDKVAKVAFDAFIAASVCDFPIFCDEAMDKLVSVGLAYPINQQGETIIDPERLDLWEAYGYFGDGGKPMVKGLK